MDRVLMDTWGPHPASCDEFDNDEEQRFDYAAAETERADRDAAKRKERDDGAGGAVKKAKNPAEKAEKTEKAEKAEKAVAGEGGDGESKEKLRLMTREEAGRVAKVPQVGDYRSFKIATKRGGVIESAPMRLESQGELFVHPEGPGVSRVMEKHVKTKLDFTFHAAMFSIYRREDTGEVMHLLEFPDADYLEVIPKTIYKKLLKMSPDKNTKWENISKRDVFRSDGVVSTVPAWPSRPFFDDEKADAKPEAKMEAKQEVKTEPKPEKGRAVTSAPRRSESPPPRRSLSPKRAPRRSESPAPRRSHSPKHAPRRSESPPHLRSISPKRAPRRSESPPTRSSPSPFKRHFPAPPTAARPAKPPKGLHPITNGNVATMLKKAVEDGEGVAELATRLLAAVEREGDDGQRALCKHLAANMNAHRAEAGEDRHFLKTPWTVSPELGDASVPEIKEWVDENLEGLDRDAMHAGVKMACGVFNTLFRGVKPEQKKSKKKVEL